VQHCYAALHTVSLVHGCFAGKCILTGSTEQRYFKVDGSTEKKWDTVIPVDLKTPCKWDIHVPLVTKGLNHKNNEETTIKLKIAVKECIVTFPHQLRRQKRKIAI